MLATLEISAADGGKAQETKGGARGCAAAQANNGRGEWKKRSGRTSAPFTSGMTVAPEGGKPQDAACVKQNGQCSKCIPSLAGLERCAPSAWCALRPFAVQISLETDKLPLAETASAWEIDGASAATRIAKHAIHAVMRCLYRLKTMLPNNFDQAKFLNYRAKRTLDKSAKRLPILRLIE